MQVKAYKDAEENKRFEEINKFVLKLLSLLWSNAGVERVFSQMNGLKRSGKCCYQYEVPTCYLKLIGSGESYNNNIEN